MVGLVERPVQQETGVGLARDGAGYEDVVAGRFRWRILKSSRAALLGPGGLKLEDWLASGQAQIVKRGTQRTVYRVALPQGTFYVKHNHVPDWKTLLRQSIRPSKAWWEFRQTLSLTGRGVSTAQPLAFGTEQTWLTAGASFLITAGLDDTEPLNDFLIHRLRALPPRRQARLRQLMAQRLGAWVAHAHEAGLWHGDFHAGNILVRWDGADKIDLFLIDLSTVMLFGPLRPHDSFAQLAMFSHWFLMRSQRTDRLRFWRAYTQARSAKWQQRLGPDAHARRNFSSLLEDRCWLSNRRFWKDRDRRCLESNRYYRRIRDRNITGHAVRDLDEAELRRLSADPDAPFKKPGVKLLKNSRSSTVAELTVTVNGKPRAVVYKRFRVTSWTDPLASLFRTSPAVRSWIHGQGFRERGLPTARPLAVLERRGRLGLRREGYLLTEKIEHAQELHHHLESLGSLPTPSRTRRLRQLTSDLAHRMRELHDRRYAHRDLKAANVLVASHDDTAALKIPADFSTLGGFLHLLQPGLVFIDLVGVTAHERLSAQRKQQNLARLNASFLRHPLVTRTEKLRFLQTYLQWHLCGRPQWKSWWKAIDRATQAKVSRNQKSGRVLA